MFFISLVKFCNAVRIQILHTCAINSFWLLHRMAAPDSPWMSGGWRPAFSQKYQDLWAHGYTHPGLRTTSEEYSHTHMM